MAKSKVTGLEDSHVAVSLALYMHFLAEVVPACRYGSCSIVARFSPLILDLWYISSSFSSKTYQHQSYNDGIPAGSVAKTLPLTHGPTNERQCSAGMPICSIPGGHQHGRIRSPPLQLQCKRNQPTETAPIIRETFRSLSMRRLQRSEGIDVVFSRENKVMA